MRLRIPFSLSLTISVLLHFFVLYMLFFLLKYVIVLKKETSTLEVTVEEAPGSEESKEAKQAKAEGREKAAKAAGKEFSDVIERLETTSDWRKKYSETFSNVFENSEVPQKYIQRYRDYEDIVVKDIFPTIENIDQKFSQQLDNASETLQKYEKRNRIIRQYREGDFVSITLEKSGDENLKASPALEFPEPERNAYFDKTLPLRKEDQFKSFIGDYFSYHKDKGDLPVGVRELYYKNLQRIAFVFSDDPTYFMVDYFQENLNKEDFLIRAMELVSRHRNTKTSAEMLFALEDIYEIQMRAWKQFFKFSEEEESLAAGREQEIRIATLRAVKERYQKVLENKDIKDYNQLSKIYFKRREEIINEILNTPEQYRAQDALFELGTIYWQKGEEYQNPEDFEKAKEIWLKIPVTPATGEFLNEETYNILREELKHNPVSTHRVGNILRRGTQRNIQEKSERERRLLYRDK